MGSNDNVRPMRLVTNTDRRRSMDAINKWLPSIGDGQMVSWLEAEKATGVRMDNNGRALVRISAKRMGRPYRAVRGLGFETSSADNGMDIVAGKIGKTLRSIADTKQTTDTIVGRHIEQMTQDAKNRILQTQATFATLQLSASLAKRLPEGK